MGRAKVISYHTPWTDEGDFSNLVLGPCYACAGTPVEGPIGWTKVNCTVPGNCGPYSSTVPGEMPSHRTRVIIIFPSKIIPVLQENIFPGYLCS